MSKNFSEDLVSSMFLNDQGDDTHPSVTECQQFLYADPRIKYFFEVSLPASQRRKEVLGHILFVCPDTRTRTYFLQMLQNRHPVNYSMTKFNSIGQPGDLVGLLTNMSLGDALVCEAQSANIQDSLIEILPAALSSFVSDIVIGKGPSAQSIRINLPKFTFVACVANETSAIRKLLPHFEYVLKVDNTSLPNLCAAQLHSSASAASISIDDTACDLIISKAQYDVTQSERYLKRILEYISTQESKANRITRELAEYVFDISGMAAKLEIPSDEEEMFSIFRDIQETLHLMHHDIHQMREDVGSSLTRIEEALDCLGGNC